MKTRTCLMLVMAGTMACNTPAFAQASPMMTLKEAVRRAIATSDSLRSAEAKIEATRAKLGEINASRLPSVSISLMPLHLGILDSGLHAMLNKFAPGMSLDMMSETLTVSQVLYDGGRSDVARHATELGTELAWHAERLARQNVAFESANGYLNVLRAESLARVMTSTRQQGEQHLKDAQLRERTGSGSRFETLQAETALATIQEHVIRSRNAVKLARLSLGNVTHQSLGNRALDPTPTLPVVSSNEADILRALEQRPEVEMANRQRQLDRSSIDLTSKDYLPVAGMQGVVAAQGLSVPGYALIGSLNWTIFDGFKTQAKIVQQQKTVEGDESNLSALRDSLRFEVEKALAERDEARERITATEQALKTAQAGFDLATLRYNEGAGTGTEVIDAASALSQAESAKIQATYDALTTELKLAKALGVELEALLTRD